MSFVLCPAAAIPTATDADYDAFHITLLMSKL
ncbi:hypothetical protein X965_10075 [Morganella sp. EGD-HP17]|nr:hypothetical protein X965_10075 [Morganella sp. EGD-HP17]